MSFVLRLTTHGRSIARSLGLIPVLSRILSRFRGAKQYEERFSNALVGAVCPGDIVWDVGANVGYYTRRLSDRAGPNGYVCAFEPVPSCFAKVEQLALPNVKAINVALGSTDETLHMTMSTDPLGVSHSLAAPPPDAGNSIPVQVVRGDKIRSTLSLPQPNVVKIDVEGFEEEVLLGMRETVANKSCRAVFVEVHFGILEQRGQRQAPSRIESLLRSSGYKTSWIDVSALQATRTG